MYYLLILVLFLFSCTSGNQEKNQNIIHKDTVVTPVVMEPVPDTADSVLFNFSHDKPVFKEVPVKLATGDSFHLKIPRDYEISIAAEGLKRLRFLSLAPDGRLFATDMHDLSDNKNGRILIFENWDDGLNKFTNVITYLDGLHNPNQVAFYKDHIYIAETDKLTRYVYRKGDVQPTGRPEVLATFPDYGLSYKYGGWHLTRSLAFHKDKLYVSVGSSCNACIEKEDIRAIIMEMDPDGGQQKIYARGLRNTVGIKWIGNKLWGTGMGRDLIGPDKPEDVLQQIEQGKFYGWPYYFQFRGKISADPEFRDSARASWVKEPPIASCGFKAHSAPLGFNYFNDFDDPLLNNSLLVCLHGSTSVWRERGNAIVKAGKGNNYTEIVSGFLSGKTEADRHGRPCDILMVSKTSFFFTDDLNGVLYFVKRSGPKLL